jgi:hypothetical protein
LFTGTGVPLSLKTPQLAGVFSNVTAVLYARKNESNVEINLYILYTWKNYKNEVCNFNSLGSIIA